MFTQKELNLQQRMWLQLLKDYDMTFLYHPDKANIYVDALCRMTIVSLCHIDKSKKDLVKDIHRLARLGVRLEDSSNGGFMVHHNSELSFVVVVKFEQHHDKSFMKCKESFFGKLNEAFSLGVMLF